MTATFDTNVLLSSTLWEGSISQKLLYGMIRRDMKICTSADILSEYNDVLKRDFGFLQDEVDEVMNVVLQFVTLVKPEEVIPVVVDDPKDDIIIACAVESKSLCIITYDVHLLKLEDFNGIRIITPEYARAMI